MSKKKKDVKWKETQNVQKENGGEWKGEYKSNEHELAMGKK